MPLAYYAACLRSYVNASAATQLSHTQVSKRAERAIDFRLMLNDAANYFEDI